MTKARRSTARRAKPGARPQAGSDKSQPPRRRATAVATEGRLVLVEGPANSRLFVYVTTNYLHRIEQERRGLYSGDLELAVVAELIGIAGAEPGMRDAAYREKHRTFATPVAIEDLRAVNASSLANASGVPRETVRRKIRRLLKIGLIIEKEPARYVLKPGILLEPHRQAMFARGIDQTVRFINELLDHGLVRWVPTKKPRHGAATARSKG